MTDYKLNYDNWNATSFIEGERVTFGGGGVGEIAILYELAGNTGEIYFSLLSGAAPADNETITAVGGATADVNGAPFISRFPVKIRDDLTYNSTTGDIRLSGTAPPLGTTHSCLYDNEANGPFNLNERITFGNGSRAEIIGVTDNGADGELFLRMIDVAPPEDNVTITADGGATAQVNGAFHLRVYLPNDIHYWFSDKGDDADFVGDDQQARYLPQVSRRVGTTDVQFLGNANIDDALSYRLYGGSITQGSVGSETEYRAVTISVVDADGETVPVIIQNGALYSATTTDYWQNAYAPNAASRINLLIKVRDAGAVTDRRVARFRALEYTRQYFTAPDPTLGPGITPVSLVATDDGNNSTPAATVATWTDAVLAYGLQQVDHSNGNGPQPYWAVGDLGSRSKQQFHERLKWVQQRGSSETIYGVNAQLIVGNDLTFNYDTEASGPFTEGQTITFGNGGTALILALDDQGAAGTIYAQRLTGDPPTDNETITGGGTTALVNGVPVTRLIINNLVGTFTGSDFNPANIGITLEAADATNGDLFTDLTGTQQQPPNNQQGIVNAAVGDVVTAYPWDGATFDPVGNPEPDFDRLTLAVALSAANEVAVVTSQPVPTWVPNSGRLRITTANGQRVRVDYSSYSGSTFSIASTDFSGNNAAISAGVMPVGIDQTGATTINSFTGVYTANQGSGGTGDQQFAIRVTNGSNAVAKQPAYTTAVFGSGGFSVNVTLQDD